MIVRTAAEGASAEDIERDLVFLQRLWKTIEAQREEREGARRSSTRRPSCRCASSRDLFTDDFERALVDDERTYKRILGYLKKTSPHMVERVIRYREKTPLIEASGVDAEIRSTLSRRVDLPSGGYLIFDYAEAFTVIDVNTGRFVGGRGKGSGGRLEDTITKNNLEAVKEVVRQLRLRDIGGIIVIDFIDMANPKNRADRRGGPEDRARARPDEDLRRRDLTAGARRDDAPERDRRAARDPHAQVPDLRRRRHRALGALGSGGRRAAPPCARGGRSADEGVPGELERAGREHPDRARALAARRDRGGDQAALLDRVARGRADRSLRSARQGQARRASRRSRRCRRARRSTSSSSRSAATTSTPPSGRSTGLAVCVGDASSMVGKKVKVEIERVLDGTAYATLVSRPSRSEPPITAEGEAEKPTRKPPARKKPRRHEGRGAAEEPVEPEEETAEEPEEDEPEAVEAEAVADEVGDPRG